MTGASIVTGGMVPGDGLALLSNGWLTSFAAAIGPHVIQPARASAVEVVGALRAAVEVADELAVSVEVVASVRALRAEVV